MALSSSGVVFGIDFVLNDKFSTQIRRVDKLYTQFATNVVKTSPILNKNINSTASAFEHLARRVENAYSKVGDSMKKVKQDTKDTLKMPKATPNLPSSSGGVGGVPMVTSLGELKEGAETIANVGKAVLGFLGEGVQKSMEFNAQISTVGALSGATSEQLVQLKNTALEMGESTAFSAKQAGVALEELSKAGFKPEQSMKAVNSALNLAGAGGIGLGKSADILTDTLALFGKSAEDSAWAVDILAKTSTSASTTVPLVFESLKNFVAPVKALGINMEQTSAIIGALANNGFKGSVATNTMATALANLAKPTKAMQKVMEETGFTVFDAQGNFAGMAGMVENLQKATEGMSPEKALATIKTLFGAQAMGQAVALMDSSFEVIRDGEKVILKGADALRAMEEEMKNAGGTAQEIADKRMDNLQGNVLRFQSAWEGMMISIGDALEPVVNEIVKFGTKVVGVFNSIAKSGLGKVLLHIAGALGLVATAVGTITAGFWSAKLAMLAIKPVLSALGVAGGVALLPLLKIVAVVGLIIGAVYLAYKAVEAWANATGIFTKIAGIFETFSQAWSSFNEETGQFQIEADLAEKLGIDEKTLLKIGAWATRFKTLWLGISQTVGDAWDMTMEVFDNVGKVINEFIKNYREEFDKLGVPVADLVGSMEDWKDTGVLIGKILVGTMLAFGVVLLSILLVVGLIGAGLYVLYKMIEQTVKVFIALYDILQVILSPITLLWDMLEGLYAGFQESQKEGSTLTDVFKAMFAEISDNPFVTFIMSIVDAIQTLIATSGDFGKAWDVFTKGLSLHSDLMDVKNIFTWDDEPDTFDKALDKTIKTSTTGRLGEEIEKTDKALETATAGETGALANKLADLEQQRAGQSFGDFLGQIFTPTAKNTPEQVKARQMEIQATNQGLSESVVQSNPITQLIQEQRLSNEQTGNLTPLEQISAPAQPIIIQTMIDSEIVAEQTVDAITALQGDGQRLTNEN